MKTCKLCGNEFEKLCRAHIIPDFVYRDLGMYNDHHRIQTLAIKGNKVVTGHRPTGDYDTNILCQGCDNDVIGQYETYAREALFSEIPTGIVVDRIQNEKGDKAFRVQNLDYKPFKLFLLSMLWRASITSLDAYSEVSLSEDDENRIRKMINSGDPGPQLEYPCPTWIHIKLDLPTDYILSPIAQRKGDHDFYYFPIGGMVFIYIVGNAENFPGIDDFALNENGEVLWPEFNSIEEVEKVIGIKLKP